MEDKIVLVGGGGHCKSVLDCLWRQNPHAQPVIVDPMLPVGSTVLGAKVAGGDDALPALFDAGYHQAFVTVGSILSSSTRRKIAGKLQAIGFSFPVIADPSAVISPFSVLGHGVFLGKNAIVNAEAVIGDHAIINSAAVIEHESRVGAFVHVSVGSILCGNVTVDDDAFIGAGAVVIQGIQIGKAAIVGAGCTVKKHIKENVMIRGLTVEEEASCPRY